jgi:tRNA1Val (adenine37-N6)-methyltransferase
MDATSEGTLLDGKLRYRQFCAGHRSGFEPVLLAAAIKANPGQLVLEAGTGAGAALLCLTQRVPGLRAVGLELDQDLARLAGDNFNNNGLANVYPVIGDAARPPFAAIFDHVLSNPPWHDAASTASPDAKRSLAHRAPPGLLAAWFSALTKTLKPRGTITVIVSASALAEVVTALSACDCGGITIFPLWPRAGAPAGQLIVAARRAVRSSPAVLPGLILHGATGLTAAAEAVLRGGAALF